MNNQGEKTNNSRSIQASIRFFCVCFSVFCFVVLVLTSFLMIRRRLREELSSTERELQSYIAAFEDELDAQADFTLDYMTNDPDVNVLSLNRYPGRSRIPFIYSVTQVLSRRSTRYCVNVMYDRKVDQIFTTPLAFPSLDGSVSDSSLLRAVVNFSSSLDESQYQSWVLFSWNGADYLVLSTPRNRLLLTTVFSVRDYLDSLPRLDGNKDARILMTDGRSVLSGNCRDLDDDIVGFCVSAAGNSGSVQRCRDWLLYSRPVDLPGPDLRLSQLLQVRDYLRESFSILIILSVLFCALLLAFSVLSRRYLIRFLVFPLQEIEAMSRNAEKNESFPAVRGPLPRECGEIRDALRSLVARLKKEQNERQLYMTEREHALLQYYQLQARPHFFINCLKSLYNMLELHREEQMKEMIIAFSNHLRNTFHDSLRLIPLRQELEEVSSYHTILLLDDTRPVLLNVSVPDAAMDVPVPPLVIQSFLENSYKYSSSGDSLIVFNVRADIVSEDGTEYLQLHLSDNGTGYSRERLSELNAPPAGYFDDSNVGINNLKRRISLLFGGKGRTAFYNLPSGGACALISIPVTPCADREGDRS